MTDDEHVAAWAAKAQEWAKDPNQGLDIANTPDILPDGGMIVPWNPTPTQEAYMERRLILMYLRERAENRRNGSSAPIKIPAAPARRPHPMTPRTQMTHPADNPLLDFLLAVLASIMGSALDDPALARRAAQQAIDAYQPQNTYELIATGQILSFAMAALETLRQAASPDLSPAKKLKLRGNANGLNRAARDNTRILDKIRQTAAAETRIAAWQQPDPPQDATAPEPKPANESHPDWAAAMNRVAARLRANPPPAASFGRTVNTLWIDTLKTVAHDIAQPKRHPAAQARS